MLDELYTEDQLLQNPHVSTESSSSCLNQCFEDAFRNWSQPKKKKSKKKKKKAAKKLKARQLADMNKILVQNGWLKHENDMLRQMMHLALAASRQTLRQEPIDVGFKILD